MVDTQRTGRPLVTITDPTDVTSRAAAAIGREVRDLERAPADGSSLTYRAVTNTGVRLAITIDPPGRPPTRRRDVLRQARLLDALGDVTGVAVPELFGSDPGTPPDIPPLLVMSFADGERYEPRHTRSRRRPAAAHVWTRAIAAAHMLAALHAVTPASLGIDEQPTPLAAEIQHWHRTFATCALGHTAAAEEECRRLLFATIPAPLPPAVLHGDWRLGNMACAGPEIRAVTDWSTWSVGDPRLDLAWLRLMSDPAHPSAAAPDAPALEPHELLAVYEYARGGSVAQLDWFDAFVRYKQAAMYASSPPGLARRTRFGPRAERTRWHIPLLLAAARDRLAH